jgi:CheY-like chemotaxis protein
MRLPKVLVIDNEQNVQKVVKVNLTISGYQVLVAADGEEGLRLAELEHPDLILLDLMMPGISGWDVLTAIRTRPQLQKTPVVIMTASLREGEKEKARAMGAVGYLAKPFSVDELLRQVKQVLGD